MSSIVRMVLIVNYYCTDLLVFSSSDELSDSANKYFSANSKIFSAVSALKDERERSVIYGHYIQGKSFQSLCFKLCYSRSQIFRFARQGIEHISLKVGT